MLFVAILYCLHIHYAFFLHIHISPLFQSYKYLSSLILDFFCTNLSLLLLHNYYCYRQSFVLKLQRTREAASKCAYSFTICTIYTICNKLAWGDESRKMNAVKKVCVFFGLHEKRLCQMIMRRQ